MNRLADLQQEIYQGETVDGDSADLIREARAPRTHT